MEKKTIGTLIAVLRKAKGMTQKELAERCNVSDKAVSRWERDECAPDLTLLPVLAEIFDITVDEMLRGERKSAEASDTEYQKEKTEKQMRHLLLKKELGFRDRSWIAKGIAIGGFLAAIICNALHEGLVGFFVGLAFFTAAAIAEICFLNHAVSGLDEWAGDTLAEYKRGIVGVGKNSALLTLLLLSATIPLVTLDRFYGMDMATWLFLYAPLSAAVMWLFFSLAWRFVIAKRVEKMGYPVCVKPWTKAGKKLLRRVALCVAVFGVIAAVLMASAMWVDEQPLRFAEKIYFDTVEEFIAYMEDDSQNVENREDLIVLPPFGYAPGDTWYADVSSDAIQTEPIKETATWPESHETEFAKYRKAYLWVNDDYRIFYWNNSNVYTYNYGQSEEGILYVITHDAYFDAQDTVANIKSSLALAFAADIAVGSVLCLLSVISYFKTKKKETA